MLITFSLVAFNLIMGLLTHPWPYDPFDVPHQRYQTQPHKSHRP